MIAIYLIINRSCEKTNILSCLLFFPILLSILILRKGRNFEFCFLFISYRGYCVCLLLFIQSALTTEFLEIIFPCHCSHIMRSGPGSSHSVARPAVVLPMTLLSLWVGRQSRYWIEQNLGLDQWWNHSMTIG